MGTLAPPWVRRCPDSVFMSGALVLNGAVQLLSSAELPTVAAQLNDFPRTIWAASLVIFGTINLAGIFNPDLIWGLLLERASRFVLFFTCSIYAVVVLVNQGRSGGFAAAVSLAFAFSSGWRYLQIRLWLKSLEGP